MWWSSILVAASVAAQTVPVETISMPVALGRLEIPDEIAPALMPYMACQMRAAGAPIIKPGQPVPQDQQPTGEDCTSVRQTAARNALVMLDRRSIEPIGGRQAFVAKALDNIDAFQAQMNWLSSHPSGPKVPNAPNQ